MDNPKNEVLTPREQLHQAACVVRDMFIVVYKAYRHKVVSAMQSDDGKATLHVGPFTFKGGGNTEFIYWHGQIVFSLHKVAVGKWGGPMEGDRQRLLKDNFEAWYQDLKVLYDKVQAQHTQDSKKEAARKAQKEAEFDRRVSEIISIVDITQRGETS